MEESLVTGVSSALSSGRHKGGSFFFTSIVILLQWHCAVQLQTDSDESQVTLRHSLLVLLGIFLPPSEKLLPCFENFILRLIYFTVYWVLDNRVQVQSHWHTEIKHLKTPMNSNLPRLLVFKELEAPLTNTCKLCILWQPLNIMNVVCKCAFLHFLVWLLKWMHKLKSGNQVWMITCNKQQNCVLHTSFYCNI